MATNIEQQEQLNSLMKEFIKLTESATQNLKGMFGSASQVSAEFKKVATGGEAKKTIDEIGEALEKVQEAMEETGGVSQDTMTKVQAAVEESAFKADKFGQNLQKLPPLLRSIAAAGGVFGGFLGGLKASIGSIGDFMGAAQGILGSLGQIAISVLTFPFKVLEGILGMGGGGGGGGLAEALNEVRKEFGSLKKDAGGAIRYMARHMRGELAETGLRVRRVFGNLADKLKTIMEYAKNVGPVFDLLRDSFARNAEAVGAYYKGLGLLEDGQRGLAERAQAMGQSVTENLLLVANFSLRMGKDFGLTAKLISREMGEMAKDFAHFGQLSIQELAQTTVYARKLGLEVKSLGGILDKYLNFEDAAQGAAQLSQAFGLNVDALALIKAQNPAEQVDMIRKAFFAAGRSIEGMTRQERKLLATQTGLEDANLDLVFSAKNQAFSYDQVKKSGDAAAKSGMSQEEAMRKLRDSIERLVKGGGGTTFKGFIDAFVKGFARGIRTTMEFRRFLRGLKRSIWQTFYAGREVGRAFVKMFPGVRDFFVGLRGIFDPRKFKVLRRGVVQVFKEFFKDLDFRKFMTGLQKTFFNYFDMTKPAAQKVVAGVKAFTYAFAKIFTQVLEEGMIGATKALRFIIDLITGKANLNSLASGAGGIGDWIYKNVIAPIWGVLKEQGPALGAALWDLLKLAFDKLVTLATPYLPYIGAFLFGPAVARGLIQGFTVLVGGSFLKAIGAVFLRGAGGFMSNAVQAFLGGIKGKFTTDAIGGAAGVAQGARGAAGAVTAGGDAVRAARVAVMKSRANYHLVAQLAILAAVLVAMAGAIGFLAWAFKKEGLTVEDFKTVGVAVGLAAGLMLAISGSMAILSAAGGLLSGSGGSAAAAIAAGILAVGVVGAALAYGMKELVTLFKGVPTGEVETAALALGAATAISIGLAGAVVALTGAGIVVLGPQALAAIAGLGAVTLLGAELAKMAKKMVKELGGLNAGEVAQTAVIMTAMGAFVTGLGALMYALTVGGAILSTPFGGRAYEAGLKAMTGLVGTLKVEFIKMVEIIRGLPTDSTFVKQIEIFSKLIGAFATAAGAFSSVIGAASLSLGDAAFVAMGGNPIPAKIALFATFLNLMRGAVVTLIAQIQGLISTANLDMLKKAEPMIAVLAGVANLSKALAGPAALLEGGIANDLSGGLMITNKIAMMTLFIRTISVSIQGLIQTIATTLIPALTGTGMLLNPAQLQVFKGFSEIINAVGGLIRSFTATSLTGVISRSVEGDPAKVAAGLKNYGKAVSAVLGALTGSALFTKIGELAGTLTRAAGSLSPSQLKSAQVVGPMIAGMFEFLVSVMNLVGNLPLTNVDPSQIKNINLTPIVDAVKTLFSSFKDTAVELLQKSVEITSSITPTQSKNMKGAFESLKVFFEVLKTIPEIISSLRGSVGEMKGGNAAQIGAVTQWLKTLTNPGEGGFLASLGPMVTNLNTQLSAIQDTKGLTSKIRLAGEVLNIVKSLGDTLNSWGNSETGRPAEFSTLAATQIKNAVSAMITSVNAVSDQLRGVSIPNLTADLHALGGRLGMNAQENFTIKNRHFNITINLDVNLKSSEFETALINGGTRFALARE